ncbi:glycosyltransferase family 2 protein [Mucilaginibacter mali]|uniref:Glycosyltransferase family 2 protein n=1 Tax=Mucilaginibacter mali TaxID=2740462 RepID=A0A7D4UL36_9SPHI|nr:glycosyltransferase family 2 protein [Mucilaginibacter mali]QKJ31422.1 glycosyltransferase family 2 protein [Mucilaginibacter mali]
MGAPLVSIALCTYNGAKYLREQLDTLVGQTYSYLEIVAVDDGSTDDTVAVLNEYAVRYPILKVHQNTQNLGYVKNFERAIGLCTGNYIALADQDDIWDLNKIQILLDHIGDNILIYHDSEFVDEQGTSLNRQLSQLRNFYAGDDTNVFLLENCVSGHALLFRRELLPYFTGFNSVIFHDHWLAYIACNNGSITFTPQALVKYRQHTQANTNILKQDRGAEVKKPSLKKLEDQLAMMTQFAAYPYNKDQAFKQKLLRRMQKRMDSFFSFGLAWFIFVNRDSLLFILKKSAISKFNLSLKFAWGYQLKKLFN